MDIFLLRHGIAQDRALNIPDAARSLTAKGEKQLRRVLRVAKDAGATPQAIFTSPLRRAQQTAAIASEILACPKVIETEALLPEAPPDACLRELGTHKRLSSVLFAGHEPHLSNLLSHLLGGQIDVDFKKAALILVRTQESDAVHGQLKWMLTPKIARAVIESGI